MTPLARQLAVLSLALLPTVVVGDEKMSEELAHDVHLLKEARVASDAPSLLKYVKARTLAETERAKLADLVPRLGDRRFSVREQASRTLALAGRAAIPFLKKGLQDSDPEVSRRCQLALDEIERTPQVAIMTSVVRVLAHHRPEGTLETLLSYFPCNDDDGVEQALLDGIAAVGVVKGKPAEALLKASADKEATRRMAVAYALGRADPKENIRELAVLIKDTDAVVRFHAVRSSLRRGDKEAMPALVALLTEAPLRQAYEAEDMLFRLAGDKGDKQPPLGEASQSARKASRRAWENWWGAVGKDFKLTTASLDELEMGVTLYSEYDGDMSGGRVWLAGRDGKQRWAITGLNGPNDARLLPGGRVLIAERNANKVTERDTNGKILWEWTSQSDGAIAADRLANGNTLVTGWGQIHEIDRNGKTVWSYTNPGGMRYAYRLRHNNILGAGADGSIVELDSKGKELRRIVPQNHTSGAGYWSSVELLPNGRYLMALGSTGKVVECDSAGRITWETTVPNAVWATRLRNGHTLVSDFESRRVVEVDRSGKEVAAPTLPGRMFTVRRY